jgi:hypothetical protein
MPKETLAVNFFWQARAAALPPPASGLPGEDGPGRNRGVHGSRVWSQDKDHRIGALVRADIHELS